MRCRVSPRPSIEGPSYQSVRIALRRPGGMSQRGAGRDALRSPRPPHTCGLLLLRESPAPILGGIQPPIEGRFAGSHGLLFVKCVRDASWTGFGGCAVRHRPSKRQHHARNGRSAIRAQQGLQVPVRAGEGTSQPARICLFRRTRSAAAPQRRRAGDERKARNVPAMNPQDRFDQILTSIHDAAFDDRLWPAASALIDEACGSKGNCLVSGDGTPPDRVDIFFARFCYRGERRTDLERQYFETYPPTR